MEKFSVIISSDPQLYWYDKAAGLPDDLKNVPMHINADRQVLQQYESMNILIENRKNTNHSFQIKGILINGDLTSFGRLPELKRYNEIRGILTKVPCYLGLGNHDYQNTVNDCFNNECSSLLHESMRNWLRDNKEKLNSYDLAIDGHNYYGSLSYSFDIDIDNNKKVHFIQLQNHPAYKNSWSSVQGLNRHNFYVRDSFYWLERDLAASRNRGDIIIVSLHDIDDDFNGVSRKRFDDMMLKYSVSAVFAGHIHADCGRVGYIDTNNSLIPIFRSGSASYQDYLIADIDCQTLNMKVNKAKDKTVTPGKLGGNYNILGGSDVWNVTLNNRIPRTPFPIPSKKQITFGPGGALITAHFRLEYDSLGTNYYFEFAVPDISGLRRVTYELPPDVTNVKVKGDIEKLPTWFEKAINYKDVKFPASNKLEFII